MTDQKEKYFDEILKDVRDNGKYFSNHYFPYQITRHGVTYCYHNTYDLGKLILDNEWNDEYNCPNSFVKNNS